MRSRVTIAEFARLAKTGNHERLAIEQIATVAATGSDSDSITVDAVINDSTVARDGHRVMSDGLDLSAWRDNPVIAWHHNMDIPPVARGTADWRNGDKILIRAEFAPQNVNPFAAEIGRLYKSGYLNAFSIAWTPIEWTYSTDKARFGGIDFLSSELMEVSAVSVPALTSALVVSRAADSLGAPLSPEFCRSRFEVLSRKRASIYRDNSILKGAKLLCLP